MRPHKVFKTLSKLAESNEGVPMQPQWEHFIWGHSPAGLRFMVSQDRSDGQVEVSLSVSTPDGPRKPPIERVIAFMTTYCKHAPVPADMGRSTTYHAVLRQGLTVLNNNGRIS